MANQSGNTVKTFEYSFGPGWLESLRAEPAAPNEDTILQRALWFAETGTYRDWWALQSIAVDHRATSEADIATLRDWFAAQAVAENQGVGVSEGELWRSIQRAFREALSSILTASVPRKVQDSWIAAKNHVLPILTTRRVGHHLRDELRYRQVLAGGLLDGMLAVTLVWLLARGPATKPYRAGQLCQCRWSKCGRFFLSRPPEGQGDWRILYCPNPSGERSEDHMVKADNQRRGDRKREARAAARHK